MILFADGRRFQIAGTILVGEDGTKIPFSAVTLGSRPSSFPIATEGVTPPILYINLQIIDEGEILAAMSMHEYNTLALARATNKPTAAPLVRLATAVAGQIRKGCGSCGRR